MTDNTLIDIIVPVYNGSRYIRKFCNMFSLQSDPKVRIVFVDDGSTDGTLRILHELEASAEFPMLVLHQNNGGISKAVNAGIDASDAQYIAFFDIDDVCSADYVSSLSECARALEFDVLVFKRRLLYSSSESVPAGSSEKAGLIDKEELLQDVLFDTVRFGNIHNILVKRDFINRSKLRLPEGYAYYEDYDFMYRTYAAAEKILFLDKWLYGYIVRSEGSVMSVYSPEKFKCMVIFGNLEKTLEKQVPRFAPLFKKYALSRIYWSLLWQTALVSPSYRSFMNFIAETKAQEYLKRLKEFPEQKVKLLTSLFFFSKRLYYITARTLGKRYTSLRIADEDTLRKAAAACPKPAE